MSYDKENAKSFGLISACIVAIAVFFVACALKYLTS